MTKKAKPAKTSSLDFAQFRKKAIAAAKEKGIDVKAIPDAEFDYLVQHGHVLAKEMSARLEGLIMSVEPMRREGGPAQPQVVPIVAAEVGIEVTAVVAGVVAGDVAGTIASKKVNK